jgi:hypothetical protein
MVKLIGNLRIRTNPGSEGVRPHFEVVFVPYAGRLNTKPVMVSNYEDLVSLLMELRISEDEAKRWAGKARSEGVVLISGVERTEGQLKDNGLLV